jgi:hypothetical protein
MISRFSNWLRELGWPAYDCADCIGMQQHGCYCAAYRAYGPCDPDGPAWSAVFRWLHGFLFVNTSPYWDQHCA